MSARAPRGLASRSLVAGGRADGMPGERLRRVVRLAGSCASE
jgi:hypothetical protein